MICELADVTRSQIINLWIWPSSSKSDSQTIHKISVIPIKIFLEVDKFSSRRLIVFEMINSNIVAKFMEYETHQEGMKKKMLTLHIFFTISESKYGA